MSDSKPVDTTDVQVGMDKLNVDGEKGQQQKTKQQKSTST
jgi:hypothetical protein